MNIDLHSHFFPVETLQHPDKYQDRAPKLVLDHGKLSVTSQIGARGGLGAGAYDPTARTFRASRMRRFRRSCESIRIASSVSAACRCKV